MKIVLKPFLVLEVVKAVSPLPPGVLRVISINPEFYRQVFGHV
jgi:hypothetical protein